MLTPSLHAPRASDEVSLAQAPLDQAAVATALNRRDDLRGRRPDAVRKR